MFGRQDSNSRLNFIVHMDDTSQVVPVCGDKQLQEQLFTNMPFQNYINSNSCNVGTIPSTVFEESAKSSTAKTEDNSDMTRLHQTPQKDVFNSRESEKTISFEGYLSGVGNKSLIDATHAAMNNGSLMPLIKEELKYSIQSKRLMDGKEEMKVEFKEPEPDILTEEELVKVEKRRTQNREAARRFRHRQKDRGDVLQKECQRLESLNTQLRYQLTQVEKERDILRNKFEEHMQVCPQRLPRPFYQTVNQRDNT